MCPATFSLGVLRRGGRGINRLCRDQLVNNLDIRHVNKILPSLTRRIVPCSEVMLPFNLPD